MRPAPYGMSHMDANQAGAPPALPPQRLDGGNYVIGGLAFIPAFGIVFGIAAIVIGLTSRKVGGKLLAGLGAAGILFTVVLYGSLFYFGFVQRGGIYDGLRAQLAQTTINELVPQIEFYRLQHGSYPASLAALAKAAPKQGLLITFDPSSVAPRPFYYEKVGEDHYYLRGVGPDEQVFTADDILPGIELTTGSKVGLLIERRP
jgi:hypothetical protein